MAGMLSAAQIAACKALVERTFDTTVTVKRGPTAEDAYGHKTGTPSTVGTALVGTYKPSASQLATYAEIIGSQKALMIRFSDSTDIRQGDTITHQSKDWTVHAVKPDESYVFAQNALMTTTG